MNKVFIIILLIAYSVNMLAQNVGVGTLTPQARLHIKGNADTSQLVIDAGATQTNVRPLIRLRDATGTDLLHINSDAQFNVFMGFGSGRSNTVSVANQYGLYNTFIGSNSGYFNSTGSFNTSLGRSALYQNTTGIANTGAGYKALFSNTIGIGNTSFGYESLLSNIIGSSNTAVGLSALQLNTTASANTAIGYQALQYQSFYNGGAPWHSYNTAIGYSALSNNQPSSTTTGVQNTAVGSHALVNNISGSYNSATGVSAGLNNTSGSFNSFFGHNAGAGNFGGAHNSFFGERAGYNTTSSDNSALGSFSLSANTSGYGNTAIGSDALKNCTGGFYNTSIGFTSNIDAGISNNNTVLGALCHVNGSGNTVIGFNAFTNSNNLAQLGNTTTVFCGGYANWTNYASDERIKKSVNEDVKGLDFIMRLRPVTYNLDVRAIYNLWGISIYGDGKTEMSDAMKISMDNDIRQKNPSEPVDLLHRR